MAKIFFPRVCIEHGKISLIFTHLLHCLIFFIHENVSTNFVFSLFLIDICFLSFVDVISTLSQVVTIIDLACENEEALALSSLLYVPIVKVDALEDNSAHKFVMSIRPSYHAASQALFDVMDFFEFSRVAVVYDGT